MRIKLSDEEVRFIKATSHIIGLTDGEWGYVLDRDRNASTNIKNFALNKLCMEHTLKNHGMLPSLEGALTHEAHPIAFGVGG